MATASGSFGDKFLFYLHVAKLCHHKYCRKKRYTIIKIAGNKPRITEIATQRCTMAEGKGLKQTQKEKIAALQEESP